MHFVHTAESVERLTRQEKGRVEHKASGAVAAAMPPGGLDVVWRLMLWRHVQLPSVHHSCTPCPGVTPPTLPAEADMSTAYHSTQTSQAQA
jgi:hypothetical protein